MGNKKQIDAQKLTHYGKRQLKHVPVIKLLLYLIDHDVKQERKCTVNYESKNYICLFSKPYLILLVLHLL